MIIRIVASQPISIRFGTTTNLSGNNAGASDIYIPGNYESIWDMGHINNAISIYSFNAGTYITVNTVVRN